VSEPTSTTTEAPAADDNLVTLKLAHPISKATAIQVDAQTKKDYPVNADIVVSREWGRGLIDAGLVQVDPTDVIAIREALRLDNKDRPLKPAAEGENSAVTEHTSDSAGSAGAAADSSGEADSTAASRRSGPKAAADKPSARAGS
jgi:hypothetical protein